MRELIACSEDAAVLNFYAGLRALEQSNRRKIRCSNNRNITGSINLDTDLRLLYQGENRWDYAIGYIDENGTEQVWFVEIHPAETSEVRVVINKAKWLKDWGMTRARELWQARKGLYWIASGRVDIRQHDNYRKMLARYGMKMPVKRVTLV